MKKLLSVLMVLSLVLCLGLVAFAATDPVESGEELAITKNLIVKGYEAESNTGATKYPAHSLTFTTPSGSVENGGVDAEPVPALTVSPGNTIEGASKATINITVPTFKAVGIYTYTFKEVDPEVAGVSVKDKDITVVFTVIQDPNSEDRLIIAAIHCESPIAPVFVDDEGNPIDDESAENESKKTSEFDNTYSAGALKVSKTVKGNMGDVNKPFSIKVTFTSTKTVAGTIVYTGNKTIAPADWNNKSASVTITLKNGEEVEFDNIPEGVTYKVVELDDDGETELAAGAKSEDGYTVAYEGDTGTITAEELKEAGVTNTKTASVDTGISLDSLPYILLAVLTLGSTAVLVARKRRSAE